MRCLIFAIFTMIAGPAAAERLTGVLVNPYTGYVAAIHIDEGSKVTPRTLQPCGPGCEFTDLMRRGQCMVVSISRKEAAFGYHFGPANDLANSRSQALRHCRRYGGTQCRVFRPICN